ncbi:hypothetical protein EDB83DRAFT_2321969 [Lactarius deliciosus]|nr:hypothetical protein EDB83DRAFT_2321969 [Lactarius deliciosus]
MLLSHRPKRADVVLFKELLGHLGHKRNNNNNGQQQWTATTDNNNDNDGQRQQMMMTTTTTTAAVGDATTMGGSHTAVLWRYTSTVGNDTGGGLAKVPPVAVPIASCSHNPCGVPKPVPLPTCTLWHHTSSSSVVCQTPHLLHLQVYSVAASSHPSYLTTVSLVTGCTMMSVVQDMADRKCFDMPYAYHQAKSCIKEVVSITDDGCRQWNTHGELYLTGCQHEDIKLNERVMSAVREVTPGMKSQEQGTLEGWSAIVLQELVAIPSFSQEP